MTNLSDLTASPDGSHLKREIARVERHILFARAALLWERTWPALWPASAIVGLFLAAGLLDLFAYVPWQIHTLLLLGTIGAAGYFLYKNFEHFRMPTWEEGARRVERDSILEHRPITEQRDHLAAGMGDAYAEALWRAHFRAMLSRIGKLRLALPSPQLGRRDPYALRFAVLLLLLAGVLVAGSQWRSRLAFALTPDAGSESANASVDAWINPPVYTGLPPIYLQQNQIGKVIAVPAGSELVVRVHRSSVAPEIILSPGAGHRPTVAASDDEYAANTVLQDNERLFVRAGGRSLGNWTIHAIADQPPQIAFAKSPEKTERGALKISFTAGDDYGVVSARAIIRPVKARSKGSLAIDLPLDSSAKTISQTDYRDLTENPFAGLPVEITLQARDGAGNTGTSKPMRFILPARTFTNSLGRALVEQRQNLSVDAPHAKPVAAAALAALTYKPELFYQGQERLYLILRGTYWMLRNAHDSRDIAQVQDMLWQTAMSLEENGAASAAEELRRTQQMLTQALAQGAPQSVIDALMQRYQNALQRYLEAMARNAPQANSQAQANAKVITSDDIAKMLKLIQQLSQTGSREAAAQMLALLESLLENMQMAKGGSGGQGDKALNDAMQGLSDLMGRQRQLMDKTYREQNDAGDPKDGGPAGLAKQQGKLRDDLNALLKNLDKKSPSTKSLGDAGHDMGDAQGQLDSKSFDDATKSEQKALDAMRNGAGQMAKTLMEQMGQAKPNGSTGDDDPLGRAQGARGAVSGGNVKVPDKDALARARQILEELRKRDGERGRSQQELDYLDRLLKEF